MILPKREKRSPVIEGKITGFSFNEHFDKCPESCIDLCLVTRRIVCIDCNIRKSFFFGDKGADRIGLNGKGMTCLQKDLNDTIYLIFINLGIKRLETSRGSDS